MTGRLLPALDRFSVIVLEFAIHTEAEAARTSHTRRRDAQDARRRSVSHALRGFGEVMGAASPNGPADPLARTPLQAAATLVAESCGASLKAGSAWSDVRGPVRAIEALARGSGIRTR